MYLFFNSSRLFTIFVKEIKTLKTYFSFEIQLWIQVLDIYILIMAIDMPAPTTADGALTDANDGHSALPK